MEPSRRRRAIEEVQCLVEAAEDLATTFEVATSRNRTALSHLESGDDAQSVMALVGVAIIGLEPEKGISINAIARSWGISRQLASSVANQARVAGPQ